MKDGQVVKGIAFRNHRVVGDIVTLASAYSGSGADELVFYDIGASPQQRTVSAAWIKEVAKVIDIPFCVAGGIRSVNDAERILNSGADKVSVNTPALENPTLINELADRFGSQCVVVGIDSYQQDDELFVYKNTGDPDRSSNTARTTLDWAAEVQERGAGEIVLNCMNQDGMRNGYDLEQLKAVHKICSVPLIASGGAGCSEHFHQLFEQSGASGALAASVFHSGQIKITGLKSTLQAGGIEVRL